MFDDLRGFLKKAEELGQVALIEGADWDLEIGGITEVAADEYPDSSALLFDKVKDYEPGYRVATNFLNTEVMVTLAAGFPLEIKKMELVKAGISLRKNSGRCHRWWLRQVRYWKTLIPAMKLTFLSSRYLSGISLTVVDTLAPAAWWLTKTLMMVG